MPTTLRDTLPAALKSVRAQRTCAEIETIVVIDGPDGGELESCVVLTTAPNDLLRRVHDRMPVVIPQGLEEAWLEPTDGPGLRALEPLMGPWDPAAWEAVKLERMP